MARWFQYQAKTEAPTQPEVAAVVAVTIAFAEVIFPRSIIYQARAEPVPVIETVTLDKWYEPLSEPVRIKKLATAQQQFYADPVFVEVAAVTVVGNTTRTSQVVFPKRFIYQAKAQPVLADIPVSAFSASTRTSRVVFPKSIIYQATTEPVPVVEAVTTVSAATITTNFVFSPRTIFYQSTALAPQFTETITEDKWHYPWSEPVRIKRPVAQQQFLAWSGFTPEVVTEDKWHQPLAEPVRIRRADQRQFLAWSGFTPAILEDRWHQAWSEPVRARRLATAEQSSLAWGGATPEVITEDKWHQPWSAPVRTRRLPTAEQQVLAWVATTPEVITEDKWHQPWSEPVRTRRFLTADQQVLAWTGITPEVITEDKWHQAWSQPVRVKPKVVFQQDLIWSGFTPTVATVNSTTITSNFVFAPRTITYQSLAWCPQTITTEVNSEDKWHQAWSEPVKVRRLATAQQQSLVWSGFTPPPEVIYEDKWHQAWSQPVRKKSGLGTWEQRDLFWSGHTPAVTTAVVVKTETSNVVRPRKLIYQSLAWCPQTITPEVITEDKWHQPWSTPVRVRKLATALQPISARDATVAERITEDKWHQPWSEPVRTKARLAAAQQQALIWSGFTPAPPPVDFVSFTEGDTGLTFQPTIIYQVSAEAPSPRTDIYWDHPWSEPVRRKNLSAALAPQAARTVFAPPAPPDVGTTTLTSTVIFPRRVIYQSKAWCPYPFIIVPPVSAVTPTSVASAVIFPRSIIYQAVASCPQPTATQTFTYFPLVEGDTGLTLQKTIIYQVTAEAASAQTNIDFSRPWAEPVRPKRNTALLLTTGETRFTPPAEIITEDKWHQPWSQPVRVRRLATAQQQFSVRAVVTPEVITEDKWHQAWSLPVKLKYQFNTDLQQAFIAPPIYPVLPRTIPWYSPFSEPVRQKKGLGVTLQEPFGSPPFYPIIPPFHVAVILDATETNRDVASILAFVYNRAVRVHVSIKEVPGSDPTYASIEETD